MPASALAASPKTGASPTMMPSPPPAQPQPPPPPQQRPQQQHAEKSPRVREWADLDLLAHVATIQVCLDAGPRPAPGLDGRADAAGAGAGAGAGTQALPDDGAGRERGAVPMEGETLGDAGRGASAAARRPPNAEGGRAGARARAVQAAGVGVAAAAIAASPSGDPVGAEWARRAEQRAQNSKDLRRVRTLLRYANMKVQNRWTQKKLDQVITEYEREQRWRSSEARSPGHRRAELVYPNLGTASLPDYTPGGGAVNLRYAADKETWRIEAAKPRRRPTMSELAAACAAAAAELRRDEAWTEAASVEERKPRDVPMATEMENQKKEGGGGGAGGAGGGKAPKRRIHVKGPRIPTPGIEQNRPRIPTPGIAQSNDAGRGAARV